MKTEEESLLSSYYHLAAMNRKIDTQNDYIEGMMVLHYELEKRGIEHKFPI